MPEDKVTEVARSQHGLVTMRQANAEGMTRRTVERRLAAGAWTPWGRGVYVVGGVSPSWEQRVHGTCLAGGDDVSASHRTGARLWQIVNANGRTEVTVAGNRRVRLPGTTVHESILLPDIDRTVRSGVPCTTLERTLADVSSHQDAKVVGTWIDDAIRREGLDLLSLRSCIARLSGPGRRDLRSMREALGRRLPGYDPGDSDLEIRALRALSDAGLAAPVQQFEVHRPDGRLARIDLAYPDQLIAIELDGWEYHGRRSAFDPDRIRRNELTLLGWRVYQFTATMPDELLVSTIACALAAATTS